MTRATAWLSTTCAKPVTTQLLLSVLLAMRSCTGLNLCTLSLCWSHPPLVWVSTEVKDGDGLSMLLRPRLLLRRMTPETPSMTLCARRTRLKPPKLLALATASVSDPGGLARMASFGLQAMGSTSPLGNIRMCPAVTSERDITKWHENYHVPPQKADGTEGAVVYSRSYKAFPCHTKRRSIAQSSLGAALVVQDSWAFVLLRPLRIQLRSTASLLCTRT